MQITEPQRASTPNPTLTDDCIQNLNETILAGHLECRSENAEHPEDTVQRNVNAENTLQQEEQKTPILKEDIKMMSERKAYIKNPAQQKQMVHIEKLQDNSSRDEKTHNTTYCKDWISLNCKWVGQTNTLNNSLAQSDGDVDKTSFELSSFNITSITHSKTPECKAEKFISQRHVKREITKLPTSKKDIVTV